MCEETGESEDADQAALLSMYDQLRQEVRAHGKRKTRRNLGSFTVIGLIVGYIFTSNGDARVLVLVPFVLVFLYLAHISSVNYVVQLAALLSLIETQIDSPGAEYEYYHGGLDVDTSPRFEDIDEVGRSEKELQERVQSDVRNTMNLLAFFAYLGAVLGSFYIVSTQGVPELGYEPSPWNSLTRATYIAFFISVVQVGFFLPVWRSWKAYRDHRKVLSANIRGAYSGNVEGSMKALHSDESQGEGES